MNDSLRSSNFITEALDKHVHDSIRPYSKMEHFLCRMYYSSFFFILLATCQATQNLSDLQKILNCFDDNFFGLYSFNQNGILSAYLLTSGMVA